MSIHDELPSMIRLQRVNKKTEEWDRGIILFFKRYNKPWYEFEAEDGSVKVSIPTKEED